MNKNREANMSGVNYNEQEENNKGSTQHQNKKEQAKTRKHNKTKTHRDMGKANDSQEQIEKDNTELNKTIQEHGYSTSQTTQPQITSAQENQT